MLHKNARGEGVTPSPTVPSRSAMGSGFSIRQEERSLRSAARRAIIRRERKNRAAPVGMTNIGSICFGECCMSDMNVRPPKEEERQEKGGHDVSCPYEEDTRTDLKVGHYKGGRAARLPDRVGVDARRPYTRRRDPRTDLKVGHYTGVGRRPSLRRLRPLGYNHSFVILRKGISEASCTKSASTTPSPAKLSRSCP
jgi:hypothetical protein